MVNKINFCSTNNNLNNSSETHKRKTAGAEPTTSPKHQKIYANLSNSPSTNKVFQINDLSNYILSFCDIPTVCRFNQLNKTILAGQRERFICHFANSVDVGRVDIGKVKKYSQALGHKTRLDNFFKEVFSKGGGEKLQKRIKELTSWREGLTHEDLGYATRLLPYLEHITLHRELEDLSLGIYFTALNCPDLKQFSYHGGMNCEEKKLEDAIDFLARHCPLEIFNGHFMGDRLTDRCVESLARYCKNTLLYFEAFLENLTEQGINSLAEFSNLTELCLRDGYALEDEKMELIGQSYPKLNSLELSRGWNDVALNAFATHCPMLETVIIRCTEELTDTGLLQLAKCKNLKDLDVETCWSISLKGHTDLLDSCPSIKTVVVSENQTPKDLESLRQRYPHIEFS